MRILLVNPGMDLTRLGRFAGLMEPMPCIGLASIAAVLQDRGHFVRAIDMFAEHLPEAEVLARTTRFRPDVVGFSVMTPSAPLCRSLAARVREALPGCRIVWGGVHADVFAADILETWPVDVVVHGDGEAALAELADAWSRGEDDLSAIPGVSWRTRDGAVVRNVPRPLERDLDRLPFPAWDLFPVHRYGLLPFADMDRPVLTVAGSRGCVYSCDYCSLLHSGGDTYRRRDPARVVDEVEHVHRRYGVRQVGFVDPIFPLGEDDFTAFAEEMIRRRLPERLCWLSETRADRLTPDLARLMYAAGCRRVLLGIESASNSLLAGVHKAARPERTRQGVEACRKAGIQTVGLFMIGLPGETPAQTRETVEWAVELDLDFAKFAITVPYPGSRVFADLWQKSLFRDDWESYTTFNPDPDRLVWHPEGYDPATLVRMQAWALRRFYVRPRQIRRQLLTLRTLTPAVIARGLYGVARA